MMKHSQAKFRALGNMGDVLIKMDNLTEAIGVYQKQLGLAKQIRDRGFEACAFGSLGVCHRQAKQFDKALGYHTQVTICKANTINGRERDVFDSIHWPKTRARSRNSRRLNRREKLDGAVKKKNFTLHHGSSMDNGPLASPRLGRIQYLSLPLSLSLWPLR